MTTPTPPPQCHFRTQDMKKINTYLDTNFIGLFVSLLKDEVHHLSYLIGCHDCCLFCWLNEANDRIEEIVVRFLLEWFYHCVMMKIQHPTARNSKAGRPLRAVSFLFFAVLPTYIPTPMRKYPHVRAPWWWTRLHRVRVMQRRYR